MRRLRDYADYATAGGAYLVGRLLRQGSMQQLTSLEASVPLSPLVHRILGQNPGPYTLQGTNTYLIGSSAERILIDAGEPNIPAYISLVKRALGDNARITAIICTHWHHDHVGGVPNVIDQVVGRPVPVYKMKRLDGQVEAGDFRYVEDGHRFQLPGATLRVIYTPGHTDDHLALLLEEENAIFSGDCVLGEGTTVFDDLHTYMNSLELLRSLKAKRIYPGHGSVVEDPESVIDQYITHRMQREREILAVIKEHGALSSIEITNYVYPDVALAVKLGAVNNVNHHLKKLLKEKKVTSSGSLWSLAISASSM